MNAPTILVVDDDPDMRLYLRGCLRGLLEGVADGEGAGQVFEATDGEEALKVVRTKRVDLVISDVVLSVLDGRALRQAIRNDPALRHLPVLLISGQQQAGFQAGPLDGWLPKPFNARQLLAAVELLLANSRQ